MLLAVSLLAEVGELAENHIEYDSRLLDIFRSLFEAARQADDKNTPYNPFFYLKSEGFWHLTPAPGVDGFPSQISGPGELRQRVSHASLDPELFTLIRDPALRHELQAVLIQTYCNHNSECMWEIMRDEGQIETRKQKLLKEEAGTYETGSERVRSTAFRRMIRQIYDVRCAACGVRFFFDDVDLIDAAHLVPFSESQDDRPQNGIALCKNHHWLMDHGILVPGPGRGSDFSRPIWHVRKGLDNRFREHQPVLELKHRSVILPDERRYAPGREGLEWRMETLRQAEKDAA